LPSSLLIACCTWASTLHAMIVQIHTIRVSSVMATNTTTTTAPRKAARILPADEQSRRASDQRLPGRAVIVTRSSDGNTLAKIQIRNFVTGLGDFAVKIRNFSSGPHERRASQQRWASLGSDRAQVQVLRHRHHNHRPLLSPRPSPTILPSRTSKRLP
jgi:hypothetical protein